MKYINILSTLAVLAASVKAESFLSNAKRAEIFKLTDNAVPTMDFTLPEDEYALLKKSINESMMADGYDNPWTDFSTKNATMVFTLNGEKQKFKKVNFSLGGMSSHYYPKAAYNIKIRGKDELYGRKNFRIRSDIRDPTVMRSKLFCDITNRLNLVNSISANYVKMTINGEDLGFNVLLDSLKKSTVEIEYNDVESTHLIQCKKNGAQLTYDTIDFCSNENEDNPDMTEFGELLKSLDTAKSIKDIEDIFDVENFYKYIILEWLTASWDHLTLYGHNFNVYKIPNGKWVFSLYDFDTTFAGELDLGLWGRIPVPLDGTNPDTWSKVLFKDWISEDQHILQVFNKDEKRFLKNLQEVLDNAFNPEFLFKRIDEIKDFIRPYVKEDRTPDENGVLPGRINTASLFYDFNYDQWEGSTEFKTIQTHFFVWEGFSYPLKKWVLDKYAFVCKNYDVDCSVGKKYLEDYEFKTYADSYETTFVVIPDTANTTTTTVEGEVNATTSVPVSSIEQSTTVVPATTVVPTTTVAPTTTVKPVETIKITTTKAKTTKVVSTKNVKTTKKAKKTVVKTVVVKKVITKTVKKAN
ncbi:coth protein-domain-containing protein [Neocallimastix sp. 'constans']|jgi:hypothetical protein